MPWPRSLGRAPFLFAAENLSSHQRLGSQITCTNAAQTVRAHHCNSADPSVGIIHVASVLRLWSTQEEDWKVFIRLAWRCCSGRVWHKGNYWRCPRVNNSLCSCLNSWLVCSGAWHPFLGGGETSHLSPMAFQVGSSISHATSRSRGFMETDQSELQVLTALGLRPGIKTIKNFGCLRFWPFRNITWQPARAQERWQGGALRTVALGLNSGSHKAAPGTVKISGLLAEGNTKLFLRAIGTEQVFLPGRWLEPSLLCYHSDHNICLL